MRKILTPGMLMRASGANPIKRLALLLAVIVAGCAAATTAHAQFARTWVSATGTNNSQCSVTSPCQSFAQAIAVTNSGGEIDCIGPGDFGVFTISISVTIDCEGNSNGAILSSSGPAITINTSGVIVDLIGLDLNGLNVAGSGPGVNINAAAIVNIRNCKIRGFQYNGGTTGFGILFEPSGSGGSLVVDNVVVTNNKIGIEIDSLNAVANMTVRNSSINNNGFGIAVYAPPSGTHAGGTIEQTTLAFNADGLVVDGSNAVALIGGSTAVNNGTGVETELGATTYSFKNNQIGGNGTDILGTITPYPGGLN